MKKTIIVLSVLVVVVIIGVLCVVKFVPFDKEYLPIYDDTVYFGMTKIALRNLKGTPIETDEDICDTPKDLMVFEEEIEGCNAKIHYLFVNNRLMEVNAYLSDIDYNKALSITEKMLSKNADEYSKNEKYYHTDLESDGASKFKTANGLNLGATGINYDFEYDYDGLTISAVFQK